MNANPSAGGLSELTWFKSSYSGTSGGDCVEVAITPQAVHVRDSKDLPGSQIVIRVSAWVSFLGFAGR
ncbi:DUF397 domain-containing protein [Streptomyces umbrinus]|uniref:DUF397 domain-containing protein n=1 Tax=Streptomyces umbrinus TaxID=67370 RepID=UPI0033D4875F